MEQDRRQASGMERRPRKARKRLVVALFCLTALGSLGAIAGSPIPAAASGTPETPTIEDCVVFTGPGEVCGTLNPNSSSKVGWYLAYNEGASCQGGGTVLGGEVEGQEMHVHAELRGLQPETTYTVCLVATSEGSEAFSSPVTLRTPARKPEPPEAPLTETCAGTVVPGHLCGTLNPNSAAKVGYHFDYNVGSSCAGGSETAHEAEVVGWEIPVDAQLAGLAPATTYSYCLVAENAAGATSGASLSFTTPPASSGTGGGQGAGSGSEGTPSTGVTTSSLSACGALGGAAKESCERLRLALRRTAQERLQCKKQQRVERGRCLSAVRRKAHALRNQYRRLMAGGT